MEVDIFQEVTECERPKVLEALKKKWPHNFLLHQYITIMGDYKKDKSEISQILYRSGNLEDGVYLLQTKFLIHPEHLTLFFVYTASTDQSTLIKALLETRRIPWHTKGYIFEVTMNRFTPNIGKVFVSKGLQVVVQHYAMMWLAPETKVELQNLPDDVYLDYLDESHVLEVAKNWPTFPGCEKFLAKQILNNCALGIFRKSDKMMLSSALSFHSGGIFMLYSNPKFRRKGYGDIVVRQMIKEIRKRGRIPFCTVFSDNIPSQSLVRKIGFTDFDKADYIFPSQFFHNI